MKSYWFWLLMNVIIWPPALLYTHQPMTNINVSLFGTAFYFMTLLILPLFERKKKLTLTLLIIKGIIAIFVFYSLSKTSMNPYFLLVLTLVFAEGFYCLSLGFSIVLCLIILIGLSVFLIFSEFALFNQCFVFVYMMFLIGGLVLYKKTKDCLDDLECRYDILLSEYRRMKRRKITDEEMIRQEERVLIAGEIHDSVGYKLTALLMHLEGFSLQLANQDQEYVTLLKRLANESLVETRKAVKSVKNTESGGLAGILRLIRKLEIDNVMKIRFTVKQGAFTVPLTGEQSFIIYRAIREALTNIMRHSYAREAEITFEVLGRRMFCFEISNSIHLHKKYREGFGLGTMRERLEKLGGKLDVYQTKEQFIVRGSLVIEMEETND